jgi:hypothetical protein
MQLGGLHRQLLNDMLQFGTDHQNHLQALIHHLISSEINKLSLLIFVSLVRSQDSRFYSNFRNKTSRFNVVDGMHECCSRPAMVEREASSHSSTSLCC